MAYGHAERNLAAIRQLEAETMELLSSLPELDPEQLQWLQSVATARGGTPGTIAKAGAALSVATRVRHGA